MDRKKFLRLVARWPAGKQLNLYMLNGFNATIVSRESIDEVDDDGIVAVDCFGNLFRADYKMICLPKFGAPPPAAKKNNNNQKH